jgi:hypothetical protein
VEASRRSISNKVLEKNEQGKFVMDTQKQTPIQEWEAIKERNDGMNDGTLGRRQAALSQVSTRRPMGFRSTGLRQLLRRGWLSLLVLILGVGGSLLLMRNGSPSATAAGPASDHSSRIREQETRSAELRRDEQVETRIEMLRQKMLGGGNYPLLVRLRVAYQPEHELSTSEEVAGQRELIHRLQQEIVGELSNGYDPESIKLYRYLPYLAVRVDRLGLETLSRLEQVIDLQEDAISLPAQILGSNPGGASGSSVPGADIGLAQVRRSGLTGMHQTIAILDTGIDKTHPSMVGKVVGEACFSTTVPEEGISSLCPAGSRATTAPDTGLPCQIDGTGCEHGTQVAAVAAGREVAGRSGVAPDANLLSIKVVSRLDAPGICPGGANSCLLAYDSDLLLGLEHVYELRENHRIAAVNISLSGPLYQSTCDGEAVPLRLAVQLLEGVQIPTITAAGNDGDSLSLSSPACLSSTISVGSFVTTTAALNPGLPGGVLTGITQQDQVSSFSNSGEELDLLAPGQEVTVPLLGGGEERRSGTSLAAAHVAGAWALARQRIGTTTISEVRTALVATGRAVTDSRNQLRKPRINLDGALMGLGTLAVMSSVPAGPNSLVAFPYMGDMNLGSPYPYRVKLTWRDNSTNETNFVIMRKAPSKPDWEGHAVVSANSTSYMDVHVKPNTRYEYCVFAYNGLGRSGSSNVAAVVTLPVRLPAPTNLTGFASSASTVTLNWTDNSTEVGFAVMRLRRGTTSWEKVATVPSNTATYTDTHLNAATMYIYCVCAFDNAGDSDPSNEVQVVTLDDRGFTPLPNAPSNLEVTSMPMGTLGRYGQIELRWEDNSSNEAGFEIWRRADEMNARWEALTILSPNSKFFLNTGLTPEMRYHYRVAAFNGAGQSMSTEEVSAIAPMYNFMSIRSGQTLSGNLRRGEMVRYRIYVPKGATQLAVTAQMRAQISRGDVDIFVRRGQLPTMTVSDCSSRTTSATERCTIQNPEVGDWFITVYGYGLGSSTYDLTTATQTSTSYFAPLPSVGIRR